MGFFSLSFPGSAFAFTSPDVEDAEQCLRLLIQPGSELLLANTRRNEHSFIQLCTSHMKTNE